MKKDFLLYLRSKFPALRSINSFHATGHFLCPLDTSENQILAILANETVLKYDRNTLEVVILNIVHTNLMTV